MNEQAARNPDKRPGDKRRPRIGVTASAYRGRMMWLFNRIAVWRAGGQPIRLTPGHKTTLERFDGFVIGGGDDIDATLYGGSLALDVRIDRKRDALEYRCLEHALKHDLPVLGICRGAQIMNVFLGGDLHEDIYAAYHGVKRMRTALPRKTVRIDPQSALHDLLQAQELRVNSLHHQSVKQPGEGLRIAARDRHEIVQAIEHVDGRFLLGVQWHPEFLVFDSRQQALFRALVKAARERRARERPAETGCVDSAGKADYQGETTA